MDAVTKVKERITKLADTNRRLAEDLGASHRAASRLQRERDEALLEVEHAGREKDAARQQLMQDRLQTKGLLHDRDELIRELDTARRLLMGDLD